MSKTNAADNARIDELTRRVGALESLVTALARNAPPQNAILSNRWWYREAGTALLMIPFGRPCSATGSGAYRDSTRPGDRGRVGGGGVIVLDTDVLSMLDRPGTEDFDRVIARLDAAYEAGEEVAVTIVTFEEQARGWLSYINSRKRVEDQIDCYLRLQKLIDRFAALRVLAFDAPAAVAFAALRAARRRAGTMDLKIAATARANGATLVSANARDFADLPGLKFEHFRR